jgi:predicted enzyme related to lactoylglutathione lyase
MDMKLEVVVLPVSDVERALGFYKALGWRLDGDFDVNRSLRVVQMTPPGSECSIIFGEGVASAPAGSLECLQLTVRDIEAARRELVDRGVEVGEIFHDAGGVFTRADGEGRVPGAHPEHSDYGSFATFTDPDGNGWRLQEVRQRAPGR